MLLFLGWHQHDTLGLAASSARRKIKLNAYYLFYFILFYFDQFPELDDFLAAQNLVLGEGRGVDSVAGSLYISQQHHRPR